MLARCGADKLTLVDPEELTRDNVKRHILTRMFCGWPKVMGMGEHIFTTNPECDTVLLVKRFDELRSVKIPAKRWPGLGKGGGCLCEPQIGDGVFGMKPDLVACCADSDACCQLVNQYGLENNVPVVFGGVHGAAEVAEIITLVPGQTPLPSGVPRISRRTFLKEY